MVAIRIEQVAYRYFVPRETIYNARIGSTNRDKQMTYAEFKSIMSGLYDINHELRQEGKGLLWNTSTAIDNAMDKLSGAHPRLWTRYCDDVDKFYFEVD